MQFSEKFSNVDHKIKSSNSEIKSHNTQAYVLLVLQLIYSNVHDVHIHVANKAFCFVKGYNITPHELHNHILC